MNSEIWYKYWCPECNKINWVCDGDIHDMTKMDLEGYECWGCGETFLFNEDFIKEFYGMIEGDDFDAENHDFNIATGLEKPK